VIPLGLAVISKDLFERPSFSGELNCPLPPPPVFFASVDSKEFNVTVSSLETTLPRGLGSVEDKELRGRDFG
jgi:hypothetical protein